MLSAGCNFFFALVAGMLTALRGDDSVSGVGNGCLVGEIGVLTLTILAAVFAIIQFTTAHADCVRPACPYVFNPTALAHSVALLALLVALAEGFCALVASSLGGWLGGWLGERMAS